MVETTKIFGAAMRRERERETETERQRDRERQRDWDRERNRDRERQRESCPQRLPKLSKTQNCFKIAERFSERLLWTTTLKLCRQAPSRSALPDKTALKLVLEAPTSIRSKIWHQKSSNQPYPEKEGVYLSWWWWF